MSGHGGSAVKLGLFLAGCLAVFVFLVQLSGGNLVPGQTGYRVEAILPDALGLSKNADVRQAGVQIGKVTDTRNIGRTTAVMLDLDKENAPVYEDATVLIRTKSVAGENYIEINPGNPKTGAVPDGGRLPLKNSQEATQLDEVLSVLTQRRRAQLQRALKGLGGGLGDNGSELNRFFESGAAAVDSGRSVMSLLEADKTQLAGLVDSLGRVTSALGQRREAIGILVRQGKITAEAVDARNAQLRESLNALPPFLAQTRESADRLNTFSGQATPVVRDLRLALEDLTPAIGDLRAAAPAGSRVVRDLLPFAKSLRAPVDELQPFSRRTSDAIPSVAATLREANPVIAQLSPYWREFATTFGLMGAATKYKDTIGNVGRLAILFGRGSLPSILPLDQSKILAQLESLAGGNLSTFGVNAYPEPGEAGLTKEFTGTYPQLSREPRYAR